jgi:ribosome biogenesis GTPase
MRDRPPLHDGDDAPADAPAAGRRGAGSGVARSRLGRRIDRRLAGLRGEGGVPPPESAGERVEGVVVYRAQGKHFVRVADGVALCSISSKLRKAFATPDADPGSAPRYRVRVGAVASSDPVAVGDRVWLTRGRGGLGMILEVQPRRSSYLRCAAGPRPLEQVIAANVDQIVPLLSVAEPPPHWRLLDRYLVSAEASGLPALVAITKWDLGPDTGTLAAVEAYRRIGYRVLTVSAERGDGMDELREAMRGRVSVLVGKSGVGKSSLLNVLQPGLSLKIAEISSSTGKGRHTTTNAKLYRLDFGAEVIDTPGMREFGLFHVAGDVAAFFPEMRPLIGQCRFPDCSHESDAGCAIRAAVEAGAIGADRYDSLLRLRAETAGG